MQTFYVASKFENYRAVRALVDALTAAGFQNTHDWTRTSEFDATGEHDKSVPLDPMDAMRHAEDDMRGARDADFLVLLPFPNMVGALLEVGIALAHNRQVFIVGECRYTVFWDLPNVNRVGSIDELFANLIP